MKTKNYRFMIFKEVSIRIGTPVNVDNFEEFISYLNEKGIRKVSFKYRTIIDDIPDWLDNGTYISTEDIQPWHFEWLVNKAYGQSKFLEIDLQISKP
jgi:hypothetical protein